MTSIPDINTKTNNEIEFFISIIIFLVIAIISIGYMIYKYFKNRSNDLNEYI